MSMKEQNTVDFHSVRGQIICVRFVASQLGSVLGDIKSI